MEETKVLLRVDNKQAIKDIDAFQKKLISIGKTGQAASREFVKEFSDTFKAGFNKVAQTAGTQFTRDLNKTLRDTAKGSGDTFAKGFGQSLRASLQPQLTQLRRDVEGSLKGVKAPSITTGSAVVSPGASSGSSSGFSKFGAGVVVANQALELFQKGLAAAQSAYDTFSSTIARGQEVINLSAAFENLQASVGRTDSLEKFRAATKGLISDLDLFRSANQAVILGVDKGSESFLQLTTDAIKLGRAMGIDAKASIDSLVIGIGRQSKLVLDNLGVIVQAEKAYDDYAASIHKTADSLTDLEKKTAFYDAAVKAISQSAGLLPDITLNAGEAFQQLENDASNTFNEFARGIAENSNLAEALRNLGNSTSDVDFSGLATEVAEFIARIINLAAVITDTVAPAINFLKDLLKSSNDVGAISELTRQFEAAGVEGLDAFKLAQKSLEGFDKQVGATKEEVAGLKKELGNIKNAEGVANFIGDLRDLKQLKEGELALNKTAVAAQKTKQEIALYDTAISAASAKLAGFARGADDAFTKTKTKTSDAEKAAKKFAKELADGITKLKLLGKTDDEINGVALAAKGLGIELYNGRVSSEELERAVTQMAQEGIKSGLSFADVLKGITKGFEDSSKAAEESVKNMRDVDAQVSAIRDSFSQTITGGLLGSIDSTFGTNLANSFTDAFGKDSNQLAGVIESGVSDAISTGLNLAGRALNGEEISRTEIVSSIGSILGGLLGAAVGSYGGPAGAALGQQIGSQAGGFLATYLDTMFGSKEPYGKARKEYINGLNSIIKDNFGEGDFKIGEKGLFDVDRNWFKPMEVAASRIQELLGESFAQFSTPIDAETYLVSPISAGLATIDSQLLPVFEGLGAALNFSPQFEKIRSELDGTIQQFGQILAINLENARGLNEFQLILQRAKISAEDLKQGLEDAFFVGSIKAGEFLNGLSSIDQLFQAGIPGAIGAADIAFNNFVENAQSSGQQAQDAIRDIVIEAQEFGKANNINASSIQDLSNILVNNFGYSLEQVTQLFSQLGSIGLDTIDEISNINLVDTATVVNNLSSIGFGFKDVTQGVTDAINQIDEFKRTASQEVVTDWKIRVNLEGDNVPDQVASQTNIKSISAPGLR